MLVIALINSTSRISVLRTIPQIFWIYFRSKKYQLNDKIRFFIVYYDNLHCNIVREVQTVTLSITQCISSARNFLYLSTSLLSHLWAPTPRYWFELTIIVTVVSPIYKKVENYSLLYTSYKFHVGSMRMLFEKKYEESPDLIRSSLCCTLTMSSIWRAWHHDTSIMAWLYVKGID